MDAGKFVGKYVAVSPKAPLPGGGSYVNGPFIDVGYVSSLITCSYNILLAY